MRVVVDEGVPRQLAAALQRAGLDAHRFKSIWKGFTNGRLIAAVEADGFDVLLTNDKNMASQQNLEGRTVAVVALPSNRRATVMSRLADIIDTLERAAPGQHVAIEQDGSRRARGIGPDGRTTVEELPPVPPFR
jgi:predicted nuclease of predicted toxin-antitoxin system